MYIRRVNGSLEYDDGSSISDWLEDANFNVAINARIFCTNNESGELVRKSLSYAWSSIHGMRHNGGLLFRRIIICENNDALFMSATKGRSWARVLRVVDGSAVVVLGEEVNVWRPDRERRRRLRREERKKLEEDSAKAVKLWLNEWGVFK